MNQTNTTTSKLRFWKKFGTQHHASHAVGDTTESPTASSATTLTLAKRLEKLEQLQQQLADHWKQNREIKDQCLQQQLSEVNRFVEEVRFLLDEQIELMHDAHSLNDSLGRDHLKSIDRKDHVGNR